MRVQRIAAGLLLAAAIGAGTNPRSAEAGPPCICWPIDIGSAKSLPWGDGPMVTRSDYDLARLVPDTLAVLDGNATPLVRMETIRRAALYLMRGERAAPRRAWELYGRLAGRALADAARGGKDPLPWFDVTYLVAALRQANVGDDWPSSAEYSAVYQSRVRGDPAAKPVAAEMAVGEALMRMMGQGPAWKSHAVFAIDRAEDGSLLAKNLVRLFGEDGDTLASLRARLAAPPEGTPDR